MHVVIAVDRDRVHILISDTSLQLLEEFNKLNDPYTIFEMHGVSRSELRPCLNQVLRQHLGVAWKQLKQRFRRTMLAFERSTTINLYTFTLV